MAEQQAAPNKPNGKRKEAAKLSQVLTVAKRIGRGRLGVVYAAVHSVLARRFAVKVLRPGLTRAESVQQRLRHMIREASQVEHPHIVNLVDFGQLPDNRYYITMDFVRGIQLSKVLERDGRLPLDRAVTMLMQTAEALDAAHRNRVIHGDLKPSNVMLMDDSSGAEEFARLMDFRLCPALAGTPDEADPFPSLLTYGGVDYLSPELLSGRNVDARSDIYSFGCLAYMSLTGQPPFVGGVEEVVQAHRNRDPVPPSRRSGGEMVSPALDSLILRCLEKVPADRFKTMEELLWELRAVFPRPLADDPEEENTDRFRLDDLETDEIEEPLPESPGRLRKLFYDTIYQLSELIVEDDAASEDLEMQLGTLKEVRQEADQLAAQVELAENRFEDIRRELRERESTLRYAIIDLNLAKSDLMEKGAGGQQMRDLVFQIGELENSLTELERQRRERFAALNTDLTDSRDQLKSLEHQMAVHYRRLYADLDEARGALISQESRDLYRLLERCRTAMAQSQPDTDSYVAPSI